MYGKFGFVLARVILGLWLFILSAGDFSPAFADDSKLSCADIGKAIRLVVARYMNTIDQIMTCKEIGDENLTRLRRVEVEYHNRNEGLFGRFIAKSIHAAHGCERTVDIDAILREPIGQREEDPVWSRVEEYAKAASLVHGPRCSMIIRKSNLMEFDLSRSQDTLTAINFILDPTR
jgi:hypothetical protein